MEHDEVEPCEGECEEDGESVFEMGLWEGASHVLDDEWEGKWLKGNQEPSCMLVACMRLYIRERRAAAASVQLACVGV